MKVAKLASILRLADVMDKSHKQKIKKLKLVLKDDTLIIYADTLEDLTLEAGLMKTSKVLFEKVYGINPVLKQRRGM
jgi:exopolyphosphatase/guanosine-5'-triphosphate,3'-diphosphate pyrophosphatase